MAVDSYPGQYGMIGESEGMQNVYKLIGRLSKAPTDVYISGESGTGKELVARALHKYGTRNHKPYLKFNVAAITETLLTSELFGHERGAFTGANKTRDGYLVEAGGGILFLDEVAEMSKPMQAKLLRALQERVIIRVGGTKEIEFKTRIVAASSRPLEDYVSEGIFREDLFYRICQNDIELPPLRDRGDDLSLLADYFLGEANKEMKREDTTRGFESKFHESTMYWIKQDNWPGNVRQLEGNIWGAVAGSGKEIIEPKHLRRFRWLNEVPSMAEVGSNIECLKRKAFVEALISCNGNVSRTAKELGMSQRTAFRWVKTYNLNPKLFKSKT